jgi:hypothetical protein
LEGLDEKDDFFLRAIESRKNKPKRLGEKKAKAKDLGRLALPIIPSHIKGNKNDFPVDFNERLKERESV